MAVTEVSNQEESLPLSRVRSQGAFIRFCHVSPPLLPSKCYGLPSHSLSLLLVTDRDHRDNSFASQSRSFEGQLCLPIEVFRGTTLPPNRGLSERTIAALPLQGQHLVDYPNERHLKPSASKGDLSYTKVIQSDSFLQATLLPVTCRQGRQRRQCLPCHNHEMCKTN